MTEPTFKLERIDAENARILSGNTIVGTLNWTDTCWAALSPGGTVQHVYGICDTLDAVQEAFLLAIGDGLFAAASTDLDFLLDPPTYVGPTDGERACWVYTVWKMIEPKAGKAPALMVEWKASDYAAASTIYRRVRRKYVDSPPDKTTEVRSIQEGY